MIEGWGYFNDHYRSLWLLADHSIEMGLWEKMGIGGLLKDGGWTPSANYVVFITINAINKDTRKLHIWAESIVNSCLK